MDSTLNRYILSALQTTDTAEENVHKCQKVGTPPDTHTHTHSVHWHSTLLVQMNSLLKENGQNGKLRFLLGSQSEGQRRRGEAELHVLSLYLLQVAECLPSQWFSGLKGQQTLPQLEPFCRYLTHLANTLHRSSLGMSDVERRTARYNAVLICACTSTAQFICPQSGALL